MAMARHIGGKNANLAVRDLPCGTRILPCHATRGFALLQEAGLINHQHCVIIAQMFDDILANKIPQRIGVPTVAAKQFLLPPRPSIARRLRTHPAGLTLLLAEQPIQKQAGIHRRSLLREQLPHPTFHIPQCRRQNFQRRFDRSITRP
jgi:hypothetical protein